MTLEDATERKPTTRRIQQYNFAPMLHKLDVNRVRDEMERANTKMEKLDVESAATDGLTGLHSHLAFQERLTKEVSRAIHHVTPLSLILLDVDNFKPYNEDHGYTAGDVVLRDMAYTLRELARDTDTVARYGGEEFVLVLPQMEMVGAAALAERLRVAVENHSWPMQAITASFGVAGLWLEEGAAELIASAHGALYRAKSSGRNQVICAPGPTSILSTAPADFPSGVVSVVLPPETQSV